MEKKYRILWCVVALAVALCLSPMALRLYRVNTAESVGDKYLQENYPEIHKQVRLHQDPQTANYRHRSYDEYGNQSDETREGIALYYTNPNDEFMKFELYIDMNGKVDYDGCKELYLKGATVYEHYDRLYQQYAENLLKDGFGIQRLETDDIRPENRDGSVKAIAGFAPDVNQQLGYPEFTWYTPDYAVIDMTQNPGQEEIFRQKGRIFIAFTEVKAGGERDVEWRYEKYLIVKDWVVKNDVQFNVIMVGNDFGEGLFFHYDDFFDYEFTTDKWSNYVVF